MARSKLDTVCDPTLGVPFRWEIMLKADGTPVLYTEINGINFADWLKRKPETVEAAKAYAIANGLEWKNWK
jgi:hypothetical protein